MKKASFPLTILLILVVSASCASASGGMPVRAGQTLFVHSAVSPSYISATYKPDHVLDESNGTCWQYNSNQTGGNGYRTHIVLYLASPSRVEVLRVKNGFWTITSGIDQYWRNNRVKSAVISFQYEGRYDFTDAIAYTFADRKEIVDINLGVHEGVIAVKFQVESVYMGNRFDDVAVTYLGLIGYGGGSAGNGANIPYFYGSAIYASLNQRMATRTGPNTKYTEPGTYPQSTDISVYYQTEGNGVMWGMVEFRYNGMWYRLYTGMKRIDAYGGVPVDYESYQYMTMVRGTVPRYGPGEAYAAQPDRIPENGLVKVFFQENGYAMIDYEGYSQVIRGWVPLSALGR